MVEPTHLKKILVKLNHVPRWGLKKKCLKPLYPNNFVPHPPMLDFFTLSKSSTSTVRIQFGPIPQNYPPYGRPIWVFQKIVVPQYGWFTMENPRTVIKMDDLGVPLFSEASIWIQPSTLKKGRIYSCSATTPGPFLNHYSLQAVTRDAEILKRRKLAYWTTDYDVLIFIHNLNIFQHPSS